MQDCIEENITEPITLYKLAQTAGYSPWHSARIFKELTGKTPFEYIRELRLSRAAEKLKDENKRIIDVAFDFVFDSHEGFTRAFSKQFGMNPRDYLKNKPRLGLFSPSPIRDSYFKTNKEVKAMTDNPNVNTVFVQVVDRPARKLILLRGKKATGYWEYATEMGCEIWDTLTGIKEALYEPIGMWLPDNLRPPDTSLYAQGVEVPLDYSGEIPEGCDIIKLKPCKMMVFQGQPYDDDDYQEAIGNLWEVMKTYKPEIYGFRWADEDGPRFQLCPEGYRGYIEGRPVRQMNVK